MNQIGIYNLPRGVSDAGNKALEVFTKLKRRAKETEKNPLSPSEPNLNELRQSPYRSLH